MTIPPLRVLGRGIVAGAAGTTALDAATYLDMSLRGRGSSPTPAKSVKTASDRLGVDVPGEGETRTNRVEGLGALTGIGTGIAAGVAAAVLSPLLNRLPLPVAGAVTGALAMAGSDVPMTRMGITEPSSWSTSDWLADALPHAAYGLMTAYALRRL